MSLLSVFQPSVGNSSPGTKLSFFCSCLGPWLLNIFYIFMHRVRIANGNDKLGLYYFRPIACFFTYVRKVKWIIHGLELDLHSKCASSFCGVIFRRFSRFRWPWFWPISRHACPWLWWWTHIGGRGNVGGSRWDQCQWNRRSCKGEFKSLYVYEIYYTHLFFSALPVENICREMFYLAFPF